MYLQLLTVLRLLFKASIMAVCCRWETKMCRIYHPCCIAVLLSCAECQPLCWFQMVTCPTLQQQLLGVQTQKQSLVLRHVRATSSISSTVSTLSLGFPLDSPLLISTLSIFSQSEKVTGFTPAEKIMQLKWQRVIWLKQFSVRFRSEAPINGIKEWRKPI